MWAGVLEAAAFFGCIKQQARGEREKFPPPLFFAALSSSFPLRSKTGKDFTKYGTKKIALGKK